MTSEIGSEMYEFLSQLFPICRSITGNGVRETLKMIQEHIPLKIHEIPTGTQAFDWTIPKEWNIRDAYVMNEKGNRIIDFKENNLHVVGYSIPVNKIVSRAELQEHCILYQNNQMRFLMSLPIIKRDGGFVSLTTNESSYKNAVIRFL